MVGEFLLDTHIWLWMQQNPDKLSQSVRELLEDRNNALYFSVASASVGCVINAPTTLTGLNGVFEWCVRR